MSALVLRDVELDHQRVDVSIEGGVVGRIGGADSTWPGDAIDGRGGALVPGLWDHHIHLMALAAAQTSVRVGPPEVTDPAQFHMALRGASAHAAPETWIRAVGYHDTVTGPLDRTVLDDYVTSHPLRVQHRSGALWVLNTKGLERLGAARHPGVELDDGGQPTGRIFGADDWLRTQLPPGPSPDLGAVGTLLASYGVTGVTDATPFSHVSDLDPLVGAVPQHVMAMGGPALADASFPRGLERGPVKLLLADHGLPSLDELVDWIDQARAAGRPVAVHAVTRASLVLALAGLDATGTMAGDRIEHGAVVPPELHDALARFTVVTQPNFVVERGDEYRAEVDADDRPHLYPCQSLLAAGILVAAGTDAPFGHPDPWRAIAAAVTRDLNPRERVSPSRALDLFLGGPDDPGGPARRVEVGAAADLCLLHGGLDELLAAPSASAVAVTVIGGRVAHGG